jgi:hypothetical protein
MVCSHCGHEFDEARMHQCPFCGLAPGPPEADGTPPPPAGGDVRDGPPYENASSLLDPGALLATVKAVLFEPDRTFRTMKRTGGFAIPLFFALLLGTVCSFVSSLWARLFYRAFWPGLLEEAVFPTIFSPTLTMVWNLVFYVVSMTLCLFIGSLILHGFLHLAGGANQPYETTFRVNAYVSGATSVFMILPVIGGFIMIGWSLVCGIIGLKEAHDTTHGKAALAVFLPLIFCCGCGLILILSFGGLAFLGALVE